MSRIAVLFLRRSPAEQKQPWKSGGGCDRITAEAGRAPPRTARGRSLKRHPFYDLSRLARCRFQRQAQNMAPLPSGLSVRKERKKDCLTLFILCANPHRRKRQAAEHKRAPAPRGSHMDPSAPSTMPAAAESPLLSALMKRLWEYPIRRFYVGAVINRPS